MSKSISQYPVASSQKSVVSSQLVISYQRSVVSEISVKKLKI